MGLLKKGREQGASKAAEAAKEAWDAGLLAYVFAPHTAFSSNPSSEALSAEVDGIMRIGWRLHSTAMTFVDKTGLNNVTMMFTFVRP
ncbi:MAG TPA: hypothetical protein VGV93_02960 [Acidimicrobiales bacterium]|nr:hypothetical protein [Acidimicrobiales bacterium]